MNIFSVELPYDHLDKALHKLSCYRDGEIVDKSCFVELSFNHLDNEPCKLGCYRFSVLILLVLVLQDECMVKWTRD